MADPMNIDSTPPGEPDEQPVRGLLQALWRWKLPFLACVALIPAIAYYLSSRSAPVYESSAVLQVEAAPPLTDGFGTLIPAPAPDQALNALARLIETTAVAQGAREELEESSLSTRELLAAISVETDATAGFLTITAEQGSAAAAREVASAFADAIIQRRAGEARARIEQGIDRIRERLRNLPESDRAVRRELEDQAQRLRALRAVQTSNAQIIEPALLGEQVAPRPRRIALVALLFAALLGAGVVALAKNLDRRVRRPEELEQLSGRPLLTVVPKDIFDADVTLPDASEPFQTLRASLTYFNIDRELTVVLVTSPAQGDGKTTVVAGLATAWARAGKDVVVVDADLRRSSVATRLGLVEPIEHGLGSVLVGVRALEEALIDVDVTGGIGQLRVLPGGPPPPNPSELIGSSRMRGLVEELQTTADVVIIDTSPLLAVSDALPLLEFVSGIALVGRVGTTTRDALARTRRIITAAKGTVLGVVATGARSSGLGPAGPYGYDYAEGGRSSRIRHVLQRRTKRDGARPPAKPAAPLPQPESVGEPAAPQGGPRRSGPTD